MDRHPLRWRRAPYILTTGMDAPPRGEGRRGWGVYLSVLLSRLVWLIWDLCICQLWFVTNPQWEIQLTPRNTLAALSCRNSQSRRAVAGQKRPYSQVSPGYPRWQHRTMVMIMIRSAQYIWLIFWPPQKNLSVHPWLTRARNNSSDHGFDALFPILVSFWVQIIKISLAGTIAVLNSLLSFAGSWALPRMHFCSF